MNALGQSHFGDDVRGIVAMGTFFQTYNGISDGCEYSTMHGKEESNDEICEPQLKRPRILLRRMAGAYEENSAKRCVCWRNRLTLENWIHGEYNGDVPRHVVWCGPAEHFVSENTTYVLVTLPSFEEGIGQTGVSMNAKTCRLQVGYEGKGATTCVHYKV